MENKTYTIENLGCPNCAAKMESKINALHRMGIQTAMLTGDSEENARAVADAAGINRIHPRLLPEDKLSALTAIRKEMGPTMFVGDGINDTPVLSFADVGAAMGSASMWLAVFADSGVAMICVLNSIRLLYSKK